METVSFVIPDGFRGAFVLEEDASAPPAPLSRTGGPIYTVPETGTLRVRSAAPLRDWHSATAAFGGGEPLAVEHIGPIAPYHDYTVKLRSLFSDSQGRIFFLVGTKLTSLRAEGPRKHEIGGSHRSEVRLPPIHPQRG